MIRLDAAGQAQTYQLLELIETCAAEARKGLAFGMLHAANANRPRLALADQNGHMQPQIDFGKAAAQAFNSFLNHGAQITQYAPALMAMLQAAVGQAPQPPAESKEEGEGPPPVGIVRP